MIKKLEYEFVVHSNPSIGKYYGTLALGINNPELRILGELDLCEDDYILTCIQDMHKVMRGEMIKAYAGYDENGQKIYKDWKYASIGSGEGCTVHLSKDECVVLNLYDDTETEVDPQAFYQMMCDWEKAILRWREERIEMMIEEKRKPYFREYLMKMSLDYLEQMLEREREIVREEAEKREETAEELHKKLKTEVLERIIEHEKKRGEIEYRELENWKKEKERLVDEYFGVEDNQSVNAN